MNRSVLERISDQYARFSRGRKRIADYVLVNHDKAAYMTAGELADAVGTSPSTIIRFAAQLGYDGYPEMRDALRDVLHNKLTTVERLNMMEGLSSEEVVHASFSMDMDNLRATEEMNSTQMFDDVVEAICDARCLYLLGTRTSWPLAQFVDFYLRYMMDNVRLLRFESSEVYAQALGCDARDVLLAISFPRYSSRTMEVMEFMKKRDVKIVCITDNPASPAATLADHVLFARSHMNSFVDSFVAPLSLINALIVKLGLKFKEPLFANFEQLETIWRDAGTYAADRFGVERHD